MIEGCGGRYLRTYGRPKEGMRQCKSRKELEAVTNKDAEVKDGQRHKAWCSSEKSLICQNYT